MKVLILEKDKIVAESLFHFMNHEKDIEVFLAFSKKEGDKLFKHVNFDIVICGDHLPDGDGLEILRQWLNQRPNLFCIFLTVKNDEKLKKEALDSGVKAYLVKPFDLKDLERALMELEKGGHPFSK